MSPGRGWVTEVGARSPQGLSALQVAMSARVAPLEPGGTRFLDRRGQRIGVVRARCLPDDLHGPERWIRLGAPALAEAAAGRAGKVALFLALPEAARPDDPARHAELVLASLSAEARLPLDAGSRAFCGGAAAGATALGAALAHAAATGQACLFGGVDSYYDEDVLRWLDEEGRLGSSAPEDGILPGEGAGFARIEREVAPGGAKALARVRAVEVASESTVLEDEPNLARAMTGMVHRLSAELDGGFGLVMTDLNAEGHRIAEWSQVQHRAQGLPRKAEFSLPARMGDVGAATGPLALVIAASLWRAGAADFATALVALHSDGPERGAFVLEEAP